MAKLNIRNKFLIVSVGMLLLLSISITTFLHVKLTDILTANLQKQGSHIADHLAKTSVDLILNDDLLALRMLAIEQKNTNKDIRFVVYTDPDGKIVAKAVDEPLAEQIKDSQGWNIGQLHAPEIKTADIRVFEYPILEGSLGTVHVGLSSEEIAKNVDSVTHYMVFIVFWIFSFGTALLLVLTNKIIRPLHRLTAMAHAVGLGNLDQKCTVTTKDEIGELGTVFNQMVNELRSYRDEMENKVAERTKELQKLNNELTVSQARQIQSEKMSAVGQLAAGVAHEINNPLGIILGFAQGLSRRLKEGDAMEMAVKSIEREAIRCKNLVHELLSFSRSDANKMSIVPLDLKMAVEAAMGLVEAGAKMNSVEIKMNLASDIPHIFGNPTQIQQIVVNLSNNALDAMPKGGTLQISTEVLKEGHSTWACLKVSDTGPGIPKEMQTKIFEPFFTTKPVGKGTGLGLSMVFDIVKKHSGMIELESRPGSTEFYVKFPIRAG